MTGENGGSAAREQRFEEALAACVEALEAGRGADRAALLARFPEFAQELAEFFADRDRIDHLAAPPTPAAEMPTLGPAEVKTDAPLGIVRYFGDYELLAEIARGGMGVVYKARQVSANRLVAVKLILAGQLSSAEDVRRFRSEAEAAAHLDHPHIVPIFEVGEHEGQQFYSMKLVEGDSLSQHVGRLQHAPRVAASVLATVARAVHYAHQRGVIHRDLKPANILIDAQGQPHVVDFGLAKRVEGDAKLTQFGAIVGTPSYMAPEQAEGRGKRVGPAADVYALGAILYECLTGRPPFKARTTLETIYQVVNKEPVPPSQLHARTPRDLETICLKCLRKEPEQRYDSAAALAEDLRRWQAGEPIAARPVGRGERAAKWVKRNPLVAALGTLVVLSVLGGASGVFVKYLDAKEQEGIARRKAQEAEDALSDRDAALTQARDDAEAMRKQLATSNVLLAQAAWDSNNPVVARERLEAVPPDLRRWEWHYLTRQYQGGIFTLNGHTGWVMGVAFSPDGTRLATGSADQTARLWDARTAQFLLELKGHTGWVTSVAFSPDGTRLATASSDKTARLWDARTGQLLREFKGHTEGLSNVAFSPDGTRLATASGDDTVRLWDARTGQQLLECKGHTTLIVMSVTFSPDGTRLAAALGFTGRVRLWDARTGQLLLECKGPCQVWDVAFSPDGTRLATANQDQTVRLWDARTGQLLRECKGHADIVWSVSFNPDGTRLVTASQDGTARVWDARTGQQLLECKGHADGVLRVAFSPDGTRVATASKDKTARLWDARTGQPLLECRGHTGYAMGVAFSADGARLATASYDQTARLWDARTGRFLLELKGHTSWVTSVAFSPDGTRLATASCDQTARLWDARTGEFLLEYKGHTTGQVSSVAFSPDGTRLATGSSDRTVRLWDARTGQPLLVCKNPTANIESVAFSPDGTQLATATSDVDGATRLWDARPLPLPQGEELEYRLWATRPEPDWHEEQFLKLQGSDRFAAAFHLDRLLAYRPLQRADLLRQRTTFLEATLMQDAQNAGARLLLARTAWHSPTLGPKDSAALLPSADETGLIARRTRGGLLLRQGKAAEAVAVLEATLKDRGDDRPPVEELLLAWAYFDTNQADKAKDLWTKATAWLDRGQEAVRAANVVGALPGGVLPGVALLFAPPADPRYNAFDWETWHELDVLRRELAPRFEAKKP